MFTVKTKQVKKTFDTKTKSESKKPEAKISKTKNSIQSKSLSKSVKSVLLHEKERKRLSNLNSERKKQNKSIVDEISFDSYLNFKNSLSMTIGKTINLDYDLFEAIVKKYKIKSV